MERVILNNKISELPDDIKVEVNDYIDFLLAKKKKESKKKVPKFGCLKGEIYMSPDFDAPLDDFREYS